jgi:TPR repeat protein
MPHFVRCIDGHVFDAEVSRQCPICGATVDVPAPSAMPLIAEPAPSESVVAAQAEAPATPRRSLGAQLSRSAVRIVVGGLVLGAAWFAFDQFVLPAINRPSQQAPSAPQSAAKPANASVPVNAAAPAAAPIPQIDISDAIASALKVARVNALYRQGSYAQTVDLARELAAENNPLGAYSLGVMLRSGTIGAQDLTAARKQFVTSARLGDSFGALEAARMLEQGAGGPQDIDGAKALYLFAARSGNADADAALARLNISDQRGLTIFQANDNLVAGKDVDESWKRINEMIAAHSAPAMCLAGWLYGGGHSTPRDFQHALALLHAGSKTNYPTCTWGLSRMVASGLPNLPRSLVQADVLLHLTEGGVSQERLPAVKNEIAELEKQMSDTDKAKAETMLQNGTVQDAAKN